MSKHKRIVNFGIIVFVLLVLMVSTIKVNASNVSQEVYNQGVYEFPITPESKEWKDFSSKTEML